MKADRVENILKMEFDMMQSTQNMGGVGRPITADQDKYGFTSLETYARGELETYPLELLEMYGYESIEEAEASL